MFRWPLGRFDQGVTGSHKFQSHEVQWYRNEQSLHSRNNGQW
jgi:hypothetical protein